MPSSASSTTQRSTLSLHDALPISARIVAGRGARQGGEQRRLGEREFGGLAAEVVPRAGGDAAGAVAEVDVVDVELEDLGLAVAVLRSEEHTSELQSQSNIVCRLLLRPPPSAPLFPYTTLFRSRRGS